MPKTTSVVARSALFIAALVGVLCLPEPAWPQAPEQTLFGPKRYDHPNSGTSRAADTVNLPAFVTGPFTLRIRNGDDRDGVHDASVFLNGTRILGDKDFGPKTVELERTVQLQPENEIVVAIRGRPRTHLTLSISGRSVLALPTGLAPDPITVAVGASGNLTATLSPGQAGTLSVVSADIGVATVPASISFAAGQTQVPIPVAGVALGTTTVTASANGASVSARVKGVTAINPASGAAGTLVTLTGTLFDPVPANNQVSFTGAPEPAVVIAASPSLVTVRVPALAASGSITVTTSRGTTQSEPFTVTEQSAQLGPTTAGLTALSGVFSSPVTPFVQGADPWDAFGFQVLAPPSNGTPSDAGNKLSYLSNPGFSGLDAFTYSVLAAGRPVLDGTARVRVYTADSLGTPDGAPGRCKSRSVPDSTKTPPVIRTNVTGCAIYGEVVTRKTAGGEPVTVKYVAARPSSGAAPKAAVFLIGGAALDMGISGDPVTGDVATTGGNFLVRSAQLFADAGYLAIAMDRPSDQPIGPSTDDVANIDRYRISVDHTVDILAVLREVNTDNLDVFLSGISRGALSAVASNPIAAGISLASPVTRASGLFPDRLFINDPDHSNLLPSFVKRPTHILRNLNDACGVSRPIDSLALFNNLRALGIEATLNNVNGGFTADPDDPCGGLTQHAYLQREPEAVTAITNWMNGRMTLLAGNKRPAAAFVELTGARGAPLAIDLAALTRDTDGGALSYALSHVGSSLGGTVVLDGATATYTPHADAVKVTDRFVYVVTDGRGGVSAAVIKIRIGG